MFYFSISVLALAQHSRSVIMCLQTSLRQTISDFYVEQLSTRACTIIIFPVQQPRRAATQNWTANVMKAKSQDCIKQYVPAVSRCS